VRAGVCENRYVHDVLLLLTQQNDDVHTGTIVLFIGTVTAVRACMCVCVCVCVCVCACLPLIIPFCYHLNRPHVSQNGLLLLAAGGVLCSVGGWFYIRKGDEPVSHTAYTCALLGTALH
jgi:hypothetical protein